MDRIILSESLWKKAETHLLQDDGEHFAFFLAGVAQSSRGISFLPKEVTLVQDTEFEFADCGHRLKLDTLLKITNDARRKGLALIEAHSHAWSRRLVDFSPTDRNGLKEFIPYILDDLGLPYAAIVWAKNSIQALYATPTSNDPKPIREITVIGNKVVRVPTTSALRMTKTRGNDRFNAYDKIVSRQVLALGEEGQRRIRETRVVMVGVGGIGSEVTQLLAYLGVRDFILIDPDLVDITNLNRLVGAGIRDIGKPKVEVIERTVRAISGEDVKIKSFRSDIRNAEVLDELKDAGVIFGCVDNDGARLVLNEFALAYSMPCIDCAAGIEAKGGTITEAGGRVMVLLPDGPCLMCANEINAKVASDDLASPEELEFRRRRGYVAGADIPSPSVVSLNGQIASSAVTEFMALITGFRPVRVYTFYDMLEQDTSMVKRIVRPDPKCYGCSLKAIGDKVVMKRYLAGMRR